MPHRAIAESRGLGSVWKIIMSKKLPRRVRSVNKLPRTARIVKKLPRRVRIVNKLLRRVNVVRFCLENPYDKITTNFFFFLYQKIFFPSYS